MADDDYDLGDSWTRLVRQLRQKREDIASAVLAGGLDSAEYAQSCGRVGQIDDTLALIEGIRSGSDRKQKPSRLLLPEESDPPLPESRTV
jgi:hypothetical protein